MTGIILTCFVGFFLGSQVGSRLHRRGIQADFRLQERHQIWVLSGLVLFTLGVVLAATLRNSALSQDFSDLIPALLRLYIRAYLNYLILGICALGMGLFIFLERTGWASPRRLLRLLGLVGVITLPFSLLLFLSLPVSPAVLPQPEIKAGLVMQTTYFTCVPATVANVMRYTGRDRAFSEADALAVTYTTRWGTSVLASIRALERLNLQPQFTSGLTLNELWQRQQVALLNVNETIGTNLTRLHAVLLLGINANQDVTLFNPVFGIQVKTAEEMETYWTREAIFVPYSLPTSLKPRVYAKSYRPMWRREFFSQL